MLSGRTIVPSGSSLDVARTNGEIMVKDGTKSKQLKSSYQWRNPGTIFELFRICAVFYHGFSIGTGNIHLTPARHYIERLFGTGIAHVVRGRCPPLMKQCLCNTGAPIADDRGPLWSQLQLPDQPTKY